MSEQDRTSHPVDKFIHKLYGKTDDRFSGYGKYPDKQPSLGDVMDHINDIDGMNMMLPFHALRQEYRLRGIDSLAQHPFRGHIVLIDGQTQACDSVDGEIDCLCGCGHRYSEHYDDDGNNDLMNGWVMCNQCSCGATGR